MSYNEKFLLHAIELAEYSVKNNIGGPFGAVIVLNNKIIAEGFNQVTCTNDPTAHAEMVAIREACRKLNSFQLNECEIYSSCEPCPMCLGAIYWARLKALYFASTRFDAADAGFDDFFIYEELTKNIENRKLLTLHKPMTKAIEVFSLWKNSDNKILY